MGENHKYNEMMARYAAQSSDMTVFDMKKVTHDEKKSRPRGHIPRGRAAF